MNLLTKKFFRDNPIEEISTQRFIYSILTHIGIEELADEFILEHVDLGEKRLNQIRREKEQINAERNPDVLFNFLRKNFESITRDDLIKRVLEFEEVLMRRQINFQSSAAR